MVDQIVEPREQCIDVGIHGVGRDAGAGGTVNIQGAEQRLCAMIAAAQGHPVAVKVNADLLGRKALYSERDDSAAIMCVNRAENAQPPDRRQAVEQTPCQSQLVVLDGSPIEPLHEIEGSAKSNRGRDRRGSCLETSWWQDALALALTWSVESASSRK